MLDDVEAAACIDTDRVLATGFAVGGVFASIVTCELPDRIAVLATVSGLYNPRAAVPMPPRRWCPSMARATGSFRSTAASGRARPTLA